MCIYIYIMCVYIFAKTGHNMIIVQEAKPIRTEIQLLVDMKATLLHYPGTLFTELQIEGSGICELVNS